MTVMLESVRFSKGVSEVLGRPEFVKLLVNYERGKFAIQVCDENDDFAFSSMLRTLIRRLPSPLAT
ncbi:MAG: hypothetical protein ACLUB5_01490 [Bifidobacterium dentium]